jgi:hypothetical protein
MRHWVLLFGLANYIWHISKSEAQFLRDFILRSAGIITSFCSGQKQLVTFLPPRPKGIFGLAGQLIPLLA